MQGIGDRPRYGGACEATHRQKVVRTAVVWLAMWIGIIAISGVAPVLAVCGDGVVDAGEECDNGGTCVGGDNAESHCTAESQCRDNGVCTDGVRIGTSCRVDVDCPGSVCVHCRTSGGDGCAANCTAETDIAFDLIPGVVHGIDLMPGTSGAMLHGDILTIPYPLTGREILTVGNERNGRIPVVVKAASVQFPRVHPPTLGLACLCLRGVAGRTCGGTFLDGDGQTPSTDCTLDGSVCAGKHPCAPLHGPGNAASGSISCGGVIPNTLTVTQDAGGSGGPPRAPVIVVSGTGGPGAAVGLSTSTALTIGACSGYPPLDGPDGELCTGDDPPLTRANGVTQVFVTGSATARVLNANSLDGNNIGPFSAAGTPFTCNALRQGNAVGACLASAFTAIGQPTTGDIVMTTLLCAQPGSVVTPTPTPPPALPCVGDCGGDGAVTVDEIVRMVNIALNGEADAPACPGTQQWCNAGPVLGAVGITCLIEAVNHALSGCPTAAPTLSLSVHVGRDPATHTLRAVDDLTNSGDVPVAYLTGCSAMCYPKFYKAIAFDVVGPHDTTVLVENPCGSVALCPEVPQVLAPGESVSQALDITGIEFVRTSGGDECGNCSQAPLEPGRYTVTTRFQYSTDLNTPWPFPQSVTASTEFDWP